MVTFTGYLYPWDLLDDPQAAAQAAGLGMDRVAVAASYHSVRAGTPRHPGRRVVDAHSAALYVPVVERAWEGQRLVPRDAAEWTGTDNSFASAARSLRDAGLKVDAWTVLTHSTYLGRANPELCVKNAFGEVYSYALCPAQPEVRSYARMVVNQVLELGKPDGLILEAVGALGFGHQSMHEKTDGAGYGPAVQKLLSLCFCSGCRHEYTSRGQDAEALSAQVRESIRGYQGQSNGTSAAEPDAGPVEPDAEPVEPDADAFRMMLECRWEAAAALLEGVLEQARAYGVSRIVVDTDPDPWSTGPFLPVQAIERVLNQGSVVSVLQGWGSTADAIGKLESIAGPASGDGKYGAYVLTLPPKETSSRQWAQDWQRLGEAGYEELHIYHLGLASDTRRTALAEAVRILRAA
jgi:hypothetical protein